jgi:ubiquinone/menaquinone biosynthesis C-methylase UbiE
MELEPSTERIIVENFQYDKESFVNYLMHVATYKYSLNYVSKKKVLDYGCGSGYGTALISEACSQIIGVDISPEAITHAKTHFSAPNLSYLQIEPSEKEPLQFPDSSFDVVLSFQVIEHVHDVTAYLHEIERVLMPGGFALIATPDRSSRLFSFQKPWNMWHLREYTQSQLHDQLKSSFANVKVLQTGGRQDILSVELSRTKRLRWMLLPVTLPFVPEFIRRNALRFIKFMNYNLSRRSRSKQPIKPDFDESVFSFSDHENFSVDLLAIASKKSL